MKYVNVETAFGRCRIAFNEAPLVARHIWLPGTDKTGKKKGQLVVAASPPSEIIEMAESLKRYFAGREIPVAPWAYLDMTQLTPNEQVLLRVVAEIPGGMARSYGEVAGLAGFPGGARFAGNTLAKNPFPVFIPCHRVIRADGSLGGFGAGSELKRKMLDLEKQYGIGHKRSS